MTMKNLSVRINENLLSKLRVIAKDEYRTVNAQIYILIRDYIERYEDEYGPIPLQDNPSVTAKP